MAFTPLQIADAMIQAGELPAALDALTEHLDGHPADDDARRLRIEVQRRLTADPAAALADLAALRHPTPADHGMHAVLLEAAGDLAGASAIVAQALTEQPGDAALIERRVRLLLALNQAADALDVLEALPAGTLTDWQWHRWRGAALSELGRGADALDAYTQALTAIGDQPPPLLRPQRADLLLRRAALHRQAQRYAAADADYAAAERLIPDDPLIHFLRGLMTFAAAKGSQPALARALPVCRDALDAAPEALRTVMRDLLHDEPLYRPLAAALMMNQ